MDYTEVINTMKNASLFDLYRLSVAIRHEMEDPKRIEQLRKTLKDGDTVFYFDESKNKLHEAIVVQKKIKNVVVRNIDDQKLWNIAYYVLNISKIDTDINAKHSDKLSKNNLQVGECVGFNKDGQIICGVIIKLNHKTVNIITSNNNRWRVAYPLLFKIIEGDIINQFDQKQIAQWIKQEN